MSKSEPRRIIVAGLNDTDATPITMSVKRFQEVSGLGHTTVYHLIKTGALRSVKIMGKRLIVVESYHRLVREAEAAE